MIGEERAPTYSESQARSWLSPGGTVRLGARLCGAAHGQGGSRHGDLASTSRSVPEVAGLPLASPRLLPTLLSLEDLVQWQESVSGCGDGMAALWLGKLMPSLLLRDLKVSNLLMTDKGCVKTGGCWVLSPHMWDWVSLSVPVGVGDVKCGSQRWHVCLPSPRPS